VGASGGLPSHDGEETGVRVRRFVFAGLVTALAVLVAAPGAYAETTKCTGTFNGTVTLDNVKVPRDATCTLTGTRVKGNIKVGSGATLIATNVKVGGNIQGKESTLIRVNGTTSKVGGNVQAREAENVILTNVKVGGAVQLKEGDFATLTSNKIKGDVQLFENFDTLTLNGNRIGANLQCKENWANPIGVGNLVRGSAEDQCEAIATEV
jgi:hypothetical protein